MIESILGGLVVAMLIEQRAAIGKIHTKLGTLPCRDGVNRDKLRTKLLAAIPVAILIGCAAVLGGCGFSRSIPVSPIPAPEPDGLGGVIQSVAWYATWAASVAIVLGIIGAVVGFRRKTAIAVIVAGFAVIVAMPILGWVGAHVAFLAASVGVCSLIVGALYAWHRRDAIESAIGFDLDRDGHIGESLHEAPQVQRITKNEH